MPDEFYHSMKGGACNKNFVLSFNSFAIRNPDFSLESQIPQRLDSVVDIPQLLILLVPHKLVKLVLCEFGNL